MLFAILVMGAALWLAVALRERFGGPAVLILLVLPTMVGAWLGGLRAGLLATALAAAGAAWFLLPPVDDFAIAAPIDRWRLAALVLAGTAISAITEGLHRARHRAAIAHALQRDAAATVAASEEHYRALFESAPDGLLIADRDSRYLDANPAVCAMLGWPRDELIGKNAADIVPPEEQENIAPALAALRSEPTYRREWRFRRRDGSLFIGDVRVSTLPDGNLLGMIRDVTAQKHAEAQIRQLNRLYAMLGAVNALIVRERSREALFEGVCRIAVETGGLRMAWIGETRDGVLQAPLASYFGDDSFRTAIEATVRTPPVAGSLFDLLHSPGLEPVIVGDITTDPRARLREAALGAGLRSLAFIPVPGDGDGPAALFAVGAETPQAFDADEVALLRRLADDLAFALAHLRNAARLDYLAWYDELTGLANQGLLRERLAGAIRAATAGGRRVALVLLDVERFKNVNDTLGRDAGDDLLRQLSGWLRTLTGDPACVARVAGDRFAVLVPDFAEVAEAARFLERLVDDLPRHPFRLRGVDYRIAAKLGVAVAPDDGDDADTMILHAEAALKRAKESGERFLFFAPSMSAAMAGRLSLESRLRQAVENEEFVLHYQPKFDARTGAVAGAEALIRWNDPARGLVSPREFVPVLEDTGLIDAVGRWALRQAVAEHRRWREAGRVAPRIAVNVSPRQLRGRGFVAEVRDAIAAGDASALELELTETMIVADVEDSLAKLQALRDLGVTVAIDDFGTGFSSLGYLSRLPVDTLKIDRSFVVEMESNPKGLTLVTTIVGLAHSLQMRAVAEGVETTAQAQLLRQVHCDTLQGWLFGRAVPADEFERTYLA